MSIDFLTQSFIDSLLTDDVVTFVHLLDITDYPYDVLHHVFIQYRDGRYRHLRDLDEFAIDEYVSKDVGNDSFKYLVTSRKVKQVSRISR